MAKVFTCECGMRTTEPFCIAGRWLCTICAESEKPSIVSRRAAANWKDFTADNRKVPTRSYVRNWEHAHVDETNR